jgi:hypothetical protein
MTPGSSIQTQSPPDRSRRGAAQITGLAMLVAVGLAVPGCSGHSAQTPSAKPAGAIVVGTGAGKSPTVQLDASGPPKTFRASAVAAGTGAVVAKGQVVIVNEKIQAWADRAGKPVVVDDSFARGTPIVLQLGAGQAIRSWDLGLVGKRIGSRVTIAIPAAGGSATTRTATTGALAVLVDLLGVVKPGQPATGRPVPLHPVRGFPVIASVPGRKPAVTTLNQAAALHLPTSRLLLAGTQQRIDPAKDLLLQLIQVDASTGTVISQTWGSLPQLTPASRVLASIPALRDARIGSRAAAVLPASGAGHAQVLIADVIAQV